jgi:hypothetical protein
VLNLVTLVRLLLVSLLPNSLWTTVQGFVYVIPFAVIRGLLLSSLFNGLFLRSTIQEFIFQRLETAENPATSHQPSPKHKTPQYNPPIHQSLNTLLTLAHKSTIRRETQLTPSLPTNHSQTQRPSLRAQFITKRVTARPLFRHMDPASIKSPQKGH